MKIITIILILVLEVNAIIIPKNVFIEAERKSHLHPKYKTKSNLSESFNIKNDTAKANNTTKNIKDEETLTVDPLKEINDFFKNDETIHKKQEEILKKYQNKANIRTMNLNNTKIIDNHNNTKLNSTINITKNIQTEEKKPLFKFRQKEIDLTSLDPFDEDEKTVNIPIEQHSYLHSFDKRINNTSLNEKINQMLTSQKEITKLLSENTKRFSDLVSNHKNLLYKEHSKDNTSIKETIKMYNKIIQKLSEDKEVYSTIHNEIGELTQRLNNLRKDLTLKENNMTEVYEKEISHQRHNNEKERLALKESSLKLEKEKQKYIELEKKKVKQIQRIKNLIKEVALEEMNYTNYLEQNNKERIKYIENIKDIEFKRNHLQLLKENVHIKQDNISILKEQLNSLQQYYKYLNKSHHNQSSKPNETNFNFKQYNDSEDNIDDDMFTNKILSIIKQNYHNNN